MLGWETYQELQAELGSQKGFIPKQNCSSPLLEQQKTLESTLAMSKLNCQTNRCLLKLDLVYFDVCNLNFKLLMSTWPLAIIKDINKYGCS